MSDWFEAIDTEQLADGEKKEFVLHNQEILVVKSGGSYYALSNRCPHLGGRLSQGTLDGAIITCPRHGSQFDITNGNVVRWLKGKGLFSAVGKALRSPRPLRTYRVKVDGGKVMIHIPDNS